MGSAESVGWQAARISALLRDHALEPMDNSVNRLTELMEESELTWARLSVRPTDVPRVLSGISERILENGGEIRAQVSAGIIDILISDDRAVDKAVSILERASRPAGHLIWPRLTESFRFAVSDVWGPTRADYPLMRAMKSALDPQNLFSPGRFVGGL
jgi:glycolate oxidase FAD binding subunit